MHQRHCDQHLLGPHERTQNQQRIWPLALRFGRLAQWSHRSILGSHFRGSVCACFLGIPCRLLLVGRSISSGRRGSGLAVIRFRFSHGTHGSLRPRMNCHAGYRFRPCFFGCGPCGFRFVFASVLRLTQRFPLSRAPGRMPPALAWLLYFAAPCPRPGQATRE